MRVSFPAAVALAESIKLTKASQLFEAAVETRRILIAGGAAHQKAEAAARLARILACKEFDLNTTSQIPDHVIKTAGCLQTLDDYNKASTAKQLWYILKISKLQMSSNIRNRQINSLRKSLHIELARFFIKQFNKFDTVRLGALVKMTPEVWKNYKICHVQLVIEQIRKRVPKKKCMFYLSDLRTPSLRFFGLIYSMKKGPSIWKKTINYKL